MQLRLRARMTVEAVARPADPVSARMGSRRLMASNSVSLFDSVLRGTFDRDLYLSTEHLPDQRPRAGVIWYSFGGSAPSRYRTK